ncbi:MAG: element excision factor XisH family protein [Chloroflexota bacterium]
MPAKDKYHDIVVRALEKEGWTILSEQVRLRIGERQLWIDLQIRNPEQQALLLEVKSYDTALSPVEFLKQALGQYLLYRAIIDEIESDESLYLAIPTNAHEDIFLSEVGRLVVNKYAINLVIYDVLLEEIVEWIPKQ